MLLLVGIGAWYLAQRALRPVTALTQMAERVTAHGLDQRIPAMTRDQEFNRLITVFNEMLNRSGNQFPTSHTFQRRRVARIEDPLARLQAELEQALKPPPPVAAAARSTAACSKKFSRLKSIVQKLLLLSLADAGRLQLKLEPVNLSAMLANVVEDSQAQAPSLKIEQEIPKKIMSMPTPNCWSRRSKTSQATPSNTITTAVGSVSSRPGSGPRSRECHQHRPANPARRPRPNFQRFHRADPARSGRVEGVGLGLSLAREISGARWGPCARPSRRPADGVRRVAARAAGKMKRPGRGRGIRRRLTLPSTRLNRQAERGKRSHYYSLFHSPKAYCLVIGIAYTGIGLAII